MIYYMAVSILYPSKEFCCGGVPRKHFQEVVPVAEQEVVPVPEREMLLVPEDEVVPVPKGEVFPVPTRQVLPVPDPELPCVAEQDVLPVQEREVLPVQDACVCPGQKLMRSRQNFERPGRKLEETGGNDWEKMFPWNPRSDNRTKWKHSYICI